MAVCTRHSLLAVGSAVENAVHFWDYELAKVLGGTKLGPDEEPSSLAFVQGHPLVVIGTNLSKLYFIRLERMEARLLTQLLAVLDLRS